MFTELLREAELRKDCANPPEAAFYEGRITAFEEMIALFNPKPTTEVQRKEMLAQLRKVHQELGKAIRELRFPINVPDDPAQHDVHTSHCCFVHHCKYGDDDCPVVLGQKKQEYPCETCGWESDEGIEY
jgi:hypothetical protein